ncbi:MAG: indolepyruvate ferredoxin oxidoreductase subunit alpha [Acidobacteriota bacterium]|nr:indolepyruvate ferredoxin oxidoreductase subunit alpha [Acidobacteriota bacterium]
MARKLLMGNEAIAEGAIRAGVAVATGYPGTPSSEILETIARRRPAGVYAEWSVNEKAALEVAAGAAIAGARSMVTMKQVGLNVASDPLMSLNYVGVKAGMVVVVADDPGPISSQTEQDTRRFGQFAKLVVFDPSTPEEAYVMIADAFALSEEIGRPVLFRPTTRVCHSYASVEMLPDLPRRAPEGSVPKGFSKDDGRWVIFPRLAYQNKISIEKTLRRLGRELACYSEMTGVGENPSSFKKGIAAGGVSWCYVREALKILAERGFGEAVSRIRLLKVGTVPFAERLGLDFLEGIEEALVIEELDPVIEDALIRLCGLHGLKTRIRGKGTDDAILAGENSVEALIDTIADFLGDAGGAKHAIPLQTEQETTPALPIRPPVLCAGCPHRAAFFAVKEAMKEAMPGKKAVFSGDIGCYTLGNAPPLDMVDTCLCMGAGITEAQGLDRAEPDATHFAFIGDSTFFHTGISGLINAVYNGADVVIVILDNGTTAMTGGQPHPGMARTLLGAPAKQVSIYEVCKGVGAEDIQRVDVFDPVAAKAAAVRAAGMKGVRVIIYEGPCINIISPTRRGDALTVSTETCRGCGLCIRKLGCPALSAGADKKAVIDAILCTGCGLCRSVCSFGAIGEAAR